MASFAIFDETFYLVSYLDVAAAVNTGVFSSGLQHFRLSGLAEGRVLVSPNYNEATYLQRYPDVAAAVVAGSFISGLSHFIELGYAEGRSGASAPTFNARMTAENPISDGPDNP